MKLRAVASVVWRCGKAALPVVLILLLAAALRFPGIRWGENYLYHPDEWKVVNPVKYAFEGKWRLDEYNYPSAFHYSCVPVVWLLMRQGVIPGPHHWLTHVTVRGMSGLYGLLTVLVVYFIGSAMQSRRAGLLAALALAVTPLHVVNSHYATVDVPVAFWCSLVMLMAVSILKRASWWKFVLAGLFAGSTAATKYNGGLVVLSPGLALLFAQYTAASGAWWRRLLRTALAAVGLRVWLMAAAGCVAFAAWVPYVVWEWDHVITNGILRQINIAKENFFLPYLDIAPGPIYLWDTVLRFGLGTPLLLVATAGFLLGLWRHRPVDIVVGLWAVTYYAGVSTAFLKFMRHLIPILPVTALWAGVFLAWLWEEGQRRGSRVATGLAGVLAAAVLLVSGLHAAAFTRLFVEEDVRMVAELWLREHFPREVSIGRLVSPVGLDRCDKPQLHFHFTNLIQDRSIEQLLRQEPELVVLSNYDYGDIFRLEQHLEHPDYQQGMIRDLLVMAPAFHALLEGRRGYREIARFEKRPELLGLDFGVDFPPHDWLYTNPTVTILQREATPVPAQVPVEPVTSPEESLPSSSAPPPDPD